MSFLKSEKWYRVTFKPTSDPAWKALPIRPMVNHGVIDAMVDGASAIIYVLDSDQGHFAHRAGDSTHWDDSLIEDPVELESFTMLDEFGSKTEFANAGGSIYMLSTSGGFIREVINPAALKAFLP